MSLTRYVKSSAIFESTSPPNREPLSRFEPEASFCKFLDLTTGIDFGYPSLFELKIVFKVSLTFSESENKKCNWK
jgi:hypothetical protein